MCPAAVADVIYYYHFPRRRSSVFLRGITVRAFSFCFLRCSTKSYFLSFSFTPGGRADECPVLLRVCTVLCLLTYCPEPHVQFNIQRRFIRVVPIFSFNLIFLFYFPSATGIRCSSTLIDAWRWRWWWYFHSTEGVEHRRRRPLSLFLLSSPLKQFIHSSSSSYYYIITQHITLDPVAAVALNYFSISHQHFLILPHTHWHTRIFSMFLFYTKKTSQSAPKPIIDKKIVPVIIFLLIFLSLNEKMLVSVGGYYPNPPDSIFCTGFKYFSIEKKIAK